MKARATCRKLGNEVRAYENYEDLLAKEKDLQAVVIATPDFWHAPMTNTCLKAGLHVYCEKMMSNTIEGARSMVQTMRETGKLLQIGHQRRSNPRYVFTLNRLLHEAQFCGRLTAAQATMEPRSEGRLRLAEEIRDAGEHACQIRLQGHAPVPQLALVQGTWRRPVV